MNRQKMCKVVGGVGDMKSKGGSQYYLQHRIYSGDIAISVTTSFNPYYLIEEQDGRNSKNQTGHKDRLC